MLDIARLPRKARNVPALDREARLALSRTMTLIRRFETRAVELFQEGVVKGTAHSSVGQEAIAAGACRALPARISSPPIIAATATLSPRAPTSDA